MEALQDWIEKWRFITTCDFSTKDEEFTFYHSHAMKNKPYFSPQDYYRILWYEISCLKWMDQVGFYRFSDLHQLASRVTSFAMASWGFFTSGSLPRQLWGGLAALTRLASDIVRHGELFDLLTCLPLAIASWEWVKSGTYSNCSSLARRCELEACDLWCSLELLAFGLAIASWWRVNWSSSLCSPLRVGGKWIHVSASLYFSWFFFFTWCLEFRSCINGYNKIHKA